MTFSLDWKEMLTGRRMQTKTS